MRERTDAGKRRLDSQLRKQAVIMILVSALAVGIGLVAMNWMIRGEPSQAQTGAEGAAGSDPAPPGPVDDGAGSDPMDSPP